VEVVDGLRTVRGFVLPSSVHVPWEVDLGFAYQFGERASNVPFRNPRDLARELETKLARDTYTTPPQPDGKPYPQLPAERGAALSAAIALERQAQARALRSRPRRYVLLSTDLLVYGPTQHGQGVTAFLLQRPESSGTRVSLGARFGVESELVPNRLKLRVGSYLEPSRFDRSAYRPHGTLGSDVRLFDLWRWSIRGTTTLDAAPRYLDWGVSLGLWH